MQVGVVFPQTEIGADPGAVREFAQAAEALGYKHILAFDHVLGADPSARKEWNRPYNSYDMFHEIFVLFGYLAGCTEEIEMVSGILILPQRQTALVAKQAAAIDVLTGGKLRLGVGIGWNDVEYEALGENFKNRGKRCEEQIELLRQLWTQDVVDFHGEYHDVTSAGINPLPIQRPIPIWLGGGADRVIDRIARIGDGWIPQFQPDDNGRAQLDKLWSAMDSIGRDRNEIGIEGRISLNQGDLEDWSKLLTDWDEMGASHLSVNTMKMGLSGPDAHIKAIENFKQCLI
jgi:probable F420-dependent oxidoreductase